MRLSKADIHVDLLGLALFVPPASGTVPLGVWKLPGVRLMGLSGNLLTHLTGENTSDVVEHRLVAPWSLVGPGGS